MYLIDFQRVTSLYYRHIANQSGNGRLKKQKKSAFDFLKIYVFMLLFFGSHFLSAQYISTRTSPYHGNIYHTGGNIGIGTTTPEKNLTISSYKPTIRFVYDYGKYPILDTWDLTNDKNLLFSYDHTAIGLPNPKVKMILTPESQLVLGDSVVESSAILQLTCSDKGVLIPRLTKEQIDSIANPVNGLLVFNSEEGFFEYFYGGSWQFIPNNNYVSQFLTKNVFYSSVASGITSEDTARWNEAYNELLSGRGDIWSEDSLKVFLQNRNANVGIGTYEPQCKLHLKMSDTFAVALRLESRNYKDDSHDISDTINENKNDFINPLSYWNIKKTGRYLGFYYNNEQNATLKLSTQSMQLNGKLGIGTIPVTDFEIHKEIHKDPDYVSEKDCGSFRIGFTLNDVYNSSYEFRQDLTGLHIKSIKKFPNEDTVIDIIGFGLNGNVGISNNLWVGGKFSAGEFGPITIKSPFSYESNIFTVKQNDEIKLKITNTGKLYAKKVVISINSFKDEVFYPDYNLMPLDSLENFVKQNYHLPDIPPEKDVVNQGLDIGQMQTLQMQKIEELTLYIIELNKQVKQLQEENKKLQQEITALKSKN